MPIDIDAQNRTALVAVEENLKTLMCYVEEFLNARDVSEAYAELVRARCRSFVRFCKRSIEVHEIESALVNAWLASLPRQNLSASTIDGYRRNLLVVWKTAVEDGLCDNLPIRVRKIKVPRQVVEAYTHAELRALLRTAAQLKGRHRNGNRRADFWSAFIHGAYSTALRRSDLLLVFRRQLASDGTAAIIQSKTGHIQRVRFSKECLEFAGKLRDDNGLLLPWPYHKNALYRRFQTIVRLSGVKRGSLKWIRRSAASYAESQQLGAGPKMLGHRGVDVFKAHYEDLNISSAVPITPPPLLI